MDQRKRRRFGQGAGWDPVADWYTGWVGEEGSEHHRYLAIPAVLDLLAPARGEQILDIGAGSGVLAPAIAEAGASYLGVDAYSVPLCQDRKSGVSKVHGLLSQ
jgi:2-polyprenyl-3-methyl-5-hydroxy-6-metoxy-1,4-benzoquinol methylase